MLRETLFAVGHKSHAYNDNIKGGIIEFDCDNTGFVDLVIEAPDACSPYSIGQSDDRRVLGIGIQSIRVSE